MRQYCIHTVQCTVYIDSHTSLNNLHFYIKTKVESKGVVDVESMTLMTYYYIKDNAKISTVTCYRSLAICGRCLSALGPSKPLFLGSFLYAKVDLNPMPAESTFPPQSETENSASGTCARCEAEAI